MTDFLKIPCLGDDEVERLEKEIEARIAARIRDGLLSEREVREIEGMRLRILPDLQDVQSVYENHLYRPKAGRKE
jgi:hypothetical protein